MQDSSRDHPLFGAASKLERAHRKLIEFDDLKTRYMATVRYEVVSLEAPNDLVHIVLRVADPVPVELHHLAAEIAYHLRSSLDQMLVAVAKANRSEKTNHVMFPFMDEEVEFDQKRTQGKLQGLPHEVQGMLRSERPWTKGGDEVLSGLKELANVDKHNILIPFGAPARWSIFGGSFDGGGHPESGFTVQSPVDLARGCILAKIGKNGSAQLGEIKVDAHLTFGPELNGLSYRDAGAAFLSMLDRTKQVIARFQRQFFHD